MNESNRYLRILVVDDSAVSRKLAEFAFLGRPYEVFMADCGEQALKLFVLHRPDVVITDWMMPGISGPELCRTIRKKLHCPDTYLILLTSNSREDHSADGLAAGADGYLTKPLRSEELRAQLSTARGVLKSRRQLVPATGTP
jgi:CheY-like chemotaxis protein